MAIRTKIEPIDRDIELTFAAEPDRAVSNFNGEMQPPDVRLPQVRPRTPQHAIEGAHLPPVPDGWWHHGPRLALQPVLVWWALFCAGVIDWPFRAKPERM